MADLNAYFKSIIDQDREAVVICDLNHIIIYMNPAAVGGIHGDGEAAIEIRPCLKQSLGMAAADAIILTFILQQKSLVLQVQRKLRKSSQKFHGKKTN